jgi:hypothetical protein
MVSNQKYVYGPTSLVKIVSYPGSVRVKICPKIEEDGDGPDLYDEVEGYVSVELDWFGVNLLMRELRAMRDKTFGKPE